MEEKNMKKREMKIWIDKDGVFNWDGTDLKPSEIIAMGAVLQNIGLEMMGPIVEIKRPKKRK
jgi:formylmethanofuran dehydrogenase subunit C